MILHIRAPLLCYLILLSKVATHTPFRRLNMASDDLLFYDAYNIYADVSHTRNHQLARLARTGEH